MKLIRLLLIVFGLLSLLSLSVFASKNAKELKADQDSAENNIPSTVFEEIERNFPQKRSPQIIVSGAGSGPSSISLYTLATDPYRRCLNLKLISQADGGEDPTWLTILAQNNLAISMEGENNLLQPAMQEDGQEEASNFPQDDDDDHHHRPPYPPPRPPPVRPSCPPPPPPPSKNYVVYALHDTPANSTVSAFELTSSELQAQLNVINDVPTQGDSPIYSTTDKTQKWLLIATSGSDEGTVSVVPIEADGSLGSSSTSAAAYSASDLPSQVFTDPATNSYVYVILEGADQIDLFTFDAVNGVLGQASSASAVTFPTGTRPRHASWHPNGKTLYVVTSGTSELLVLNFDASSGQLTQSQSVSIAPPKTQGNIGYEVKVHPSGRWVVTSSLGTNTLGLFPIINVGTGRLSFTPHFFSSRGIAPVSFDIDATGCLLSVVNQQSNNIGMFFVDPFLGVLWPLSPANTASQTPSPSFVSFLN